MRGLTMPQIRNILTFFLDIVKWREKNLTETYLETTQTSVIERFCENMQRLTVLDALREKTPL